MTEHVVHRVTVTRKSGFEFDVAFGAVPEASALHMDEPAPLGAAIGPNAADLLLAAVANCLSASLLLCLQRGRATVERLSATATALIERNERGRLRIAGIDHYTSEYIHRLIIQWLAGAPFALQVAKFERKRETMQ